jgi:putative tricarboxylic transport membrane protein
MSKTMRDIGVSAAIILFAALIYRDSLSLKPGNYDPLGAGTMPRIVATITIGLALVVIIQALLDRVPRRLLAEEIGFERRPWLAVQIFASMAVLAVLLWTRVPFGISSAVFLFVSVLAIQRFRPAAIPGAAAFAVVCGFGLAYIFGSVFGVDLP